LASVRHAMRTVEITIETLLGRYAIGSDNDPRLLILSL